MADVDPSAGSANSVSAANAAVLGSRVSYSAVLAQYRDLGRWQPKVGDFIIWHGWFSHWYGVLNGIKGSSLTIIRDGLPKLLFTMGEEDMQKNAITMSLHRIRSSRGGEYHILQDGVWYIDD